LENFYGIELTHHDEETKIGNELFTSYEKAEKLLIANGYKPQLNCRDEKFYEKDEEGCYWMYANIREFNLVD
jgi:hypothetical protein